MKVHLIAIGGAVMHNLALALHNLGNEVTGSDDEINSPSKERLLERGLLPAEMGWFPEKITEDIDLIILGMHAKQDNPELQKAIELGLKVQSFPEFVGECYSTKVRVAIAGSHGKTTTTSMVAHILKTNNIKFDYLIGSNIEGFDTMVSISDAPIAVLEADEYLTSPLDRRSKFLHYHPDIAVITGIAWDHINVFPLFDDYLETFKLFIKTLPKGATLIYYKQDEHLSQMFNDDQQMINLVPYEAYKHQIDSTGKVVLLDEKNGRYPIHFFGKHNLENFQAAYHVCRKLGLSGEKILEAAMSFTGAGKRMELIVSKNNFVAYLDFAHAPSKLKSTVEAISNRHPNYKKIAIYELHTFSSLNSDFLEQYKNTMKMADVAIVYFNPHTLEMKKMKMIDPGEIIHAFNIPDLLVCTDNQDIIHFLEGQDLNDSVLLWMSSGNFGGLDVKNISKTFAERIQN